MLEGKSKAFFTQVFAFKDCLVGKLYQSLHRLTTKTDCNVKLAICYSVTLYRGYSTEDAIGKRLPWRWMIWRSTPSDRK